MTRITLIQGHPTAEGGHFGHALAEAYAAGAAEAGHAVRRVNVAELDFPMIRSQEAWAEEAPPHSILAAQEAIAWGQHLALFYPLWLGGLPAVFKGFLEQCFRPGFAAEAVPGRTGWRKLLGGRSARIVVTLGMPAPVYRFWHRAHTLKSLERDILGFAGIGPCRHTLIGSVEQICPAKRSAWLKNLHEMGQADGLAAFVPSVEKLKLRPGRYA